MKQSTILVIDDTPENIDVLIAILQDDYKIKAALNGHKALKIIEASPPDLILVDVMMPEMDGYELCKRIKSNPDIHEIPVIFVTAKTEVIDEAQAFSVGAADYLTKPVSPPLVKARVKAHLALYKHSQTLEEKVRERTLQLEKTRLEIIRRLGRAAEFKDNETGLHVIRMSYYSGHVAMNLGLPVDETAEIINAAPMHDVGKIGIPDSIILNPGKLNADEWRIIKTHPRIGADIIGEHKEGILKTACEIALSHHEKWDGTGYPAGLKGSAIPLTGRIIAIADVFDALTTARPYKEAWPVSRAIDLIERERGKHFDPQVVEAFLHGIDSILEIKEKYKENETIPFPEGIR
jgi:putative two-component system response regulator